MPCTHLPCPAFLTSCRWTSFTSHNARKKTAENYSAGSTSPHLAPYRTTSARQYSDADVATCDSRYSAVTAPTIHCELQISREPTTIRTNRIPRFVYGRHCQSDLGLALICKTAHRRDERGRRVTKSCGYVNGDIGNFDPGDSITDTTNQLSF